MVSYQILSTSMSILSLFGLFHVRVFKVNRLPIANRMQCGEQVGFEDRLGL